MLLNNSLQMNIADWSGNLWVNVFAEEAEKIVGATSAEVGVAFDAGTDSLTSILEVANFKEFHFKLRAKVETFNVSLVAYFRYKTERTCFVKRTLFSFARIGALITKLVKKDIS